MINIFYWSPCLEKVGTYKATINSALSLSKYSKNLISINLINVCGVWEEEREFLENNNIKLIDIGLNIFKYLPKSGYLGSRFSYTLIALISFFPLIRLIIKQKPDFFVSHLLTSLTFLIFGCLKLQTKLILRISGFPKLTIIRKLLWKFSSKNIFKVTFPSKELMSQLSNLNIFSKKQIVFLPDPILNIKEFINKKKTLKDNLINLDSRNFFISAGRLTKQKNFSYLIREFKKFSDKNTKFDLFIFGKGEEKENLKTLIEKHQLSKRVFLMGYTDDVYEYMKKADAFILSSLWEDPGFVLIEAAFNNTFIISSNCKNGPSEFLEHGKAGILFENNENYALCKALENFTSQNFEAKAKKILAKKNCLKYSMLRHHNVIKDIFLN
jgi:glycosyltransferase involved in cell wall biosynthesis